MTHDLNTRTCNIMDINNNTLQVAASNILVPDLSQPPAQQQAQQQQATANSQITVLSKSGKALFSQMIKASKPVRDPLQKQQS